MAIVENDVVKMEWEKDGWLQLKDGTFIYASKVYHTPKVENLTIFFTARSAFVWVDNFNQPTEDRWTAAELKQFCKDGNYDDGFPEAWDQYYSIMGDDGHCNPVFVEKYGLEEFVQDIEDRLDDIRPYGETREVTL